MRPAILIADDEKIIRLLLEKTLGKKYDLVLRENGSEALKWIQSGNKPDVVISDLHMPEMDGYEFLIRIRENKDSSEIPVIMLSGMDSDAEKNRCLELGASAYFTKPLSVMKLADKIEELMKK
jgi:CheY-like chemotaxis protein